MAEIVDKMKLQEINSKIEFLNFPYKVKEQTKLLSVSNKAVYDKENQTLYL